MESLTDAVNCLKSNGVIAYPTETVYGLGCGLDSPKAIEKLYQLKKRESNHPMLVLVSGKKMLESLVLSVPPSAQKLIQRYWPGPLTVILKARPEVSRLITGPEHTIGVRHSSDACCNALLELFGAPVISTSANVKGLPPAVDAQQVKTYFPEGLDAVLDDGPRKRCKPSTIVKIDDNRLSLIREGDLTFDDIQRTAAA